MAESVNKALTYLKDFVTVQAPAYLAELPLPGTYEGFLKLNQDDVYKLVPLFLVVVVIHLFFLYTIWRMLSTPPKTGAVNPSIKKDLAKVVDNFPVDDLASGNNVYCRCWRSKTFPYCDGSHAQHNKITGDNVGPLIIKK